MRISRRVGRRTFVSVGPVCAALALTSKALFVFPIQVCIKTVELSAIVLRGIWREIARAR